MHTHPVISADRPVARTPEAGSPATKAPKSAAGGGDFADLLKAAEGAPAGTPEAQNPAAARSAQRQGAGH